MKRKEVKRDQGQVNAHGKAQWYTTIQGTKSSQSWSEYAVFWESGQR